MHGNLALVKLVARDTSLNGPVGLAVPSGYPAQSTIEKLPFRGRRNNRYVTVGGNAHLQCLVRVPPYGGVIFSSIGGVTREGCLTHRP